MPPAPPPRPASPTPAPAAGRRSPLDVGLCERCNPLGLRDAASSQVHGTVFLADRRRGRRLWRRRPARGARGSGRSRPQVAGVRTADGGAALVGRRSTVDEHGHAAWARRRAGSPTRRLAGGQAAFIQSPRIEPGATLTFDATVGRARRRRRGRSPSSAPTRDRRGRRPRRPRVRDATSPGSAGPAS